MKTISYDEYRQISGLPITPIELFNLISGLPKSFPVQKIAFDDGFDWFCGTIADIELVYSDMIRIMFDDGTIRDFNDDEFIFKRLCM